jgi:hypothetical protein
MRSTVATLTHSIRAAVALLRRKSLMSLTLQKPQDFADLNLSHSA